TTAALAETAGIGLSTARRLLTQWETAGCAQSHTDPNSPRAAKTWTTGAGAPATIEPEPEPEPEPAAPADPAPVEHATPEPVSPEPVTRADPAPATPAPADPTDEAAAPVPDVPADPDITADTALAAPTGDDPATPVPVTPAPADATAAAHEESTVERLPAGALRGQVEDFLRENPGKEFTPHQIGKALERSSGAVHNALVTLTKNGTAHQTSTAPKKFTLAS
ncbi:hypothetical protein ACW9HO_23935, partial [Nocardia gipuzkoensis]